MIGDRDGVTTTCTHRTALFASPQLNAECEKLEEQISDIKSEIEKYKGQVAALA